MISQAINPKSDSELLLTNLKEAKNASAVQKIEFANFASTIPRGTLIFAFEGPDDRYAYHTWITKINSRISYEAYQCDGKKQVLRLFDILSLDKTGLGEHVYYFVDRDFDDLQERAPSPRVYMTDCYSIESYITCTDVLDSVLKLALHCNGNVQTRKSIQDAFNNTYKNFLAATADLNFYIFTARINRIEIDKIPNSTFGYIKISLNNVIRTELTEDQFIPTKNNISTLQTEDSRRNFNKLDPSSRYRGKFSFSFFTEWLGQLRKDRISENSRFFSDVRKPENSVHGDFSFRYLAPLSPPPESLSEFLGKFQSN